MHEFAHSQCQVAVHPCDTLFWLSQVTLHQGLNTSRLSQCHTCCHSIDSEYNFYTHLMPPSWYEPVLWGSMVMWLSWHVTLSRRAANLNRGHPAYRRRQAQRKSRSRCWAKRGVWEMRRMIKLRVIDFDPIHTRRASASPEFTRVCQLSWYLSLNPFLSFYRRPSDVDPIEQVAALSLQIHLLLGVDPPLTNYSQKFDW